MNNLLRITVITFVLLATTIKSALFTHSDIAIGFGDIEQEIINKCDYNELVTLSKTSMRNYIRIHEWIEKKAHNFFNLCQNKFFQAQLIDDKAKILEKSLNCIKERYLRKTIAHQIMYNRKPDVSMLKITVYYTNGCIQKAIDKGINRNDGIKYATIFWQFLESIKKHPYISKDDKWTIFKLVSKEVKKLKISCLLSKSPYKTIEYLIDRRAYRKKQLQNCVII